MSRLRERVVGHPVAAFFALAYGISWLGFLPSVLGADEAFGGVNLLIAQFGPAIAGGAVLWYPADPSASGPVESAAGGYPFGGGSRRSRSRWASSD